MLARAVRTAGATMFSSSEVSVEVNLMSTAYDRRASGVPGLSNVFATTLRQKLLVVVHAEDITLQRRQLETSVCPKVVAARLPHKSVLS
jgi:hypothetical protein